MSFNRSSLLQQLIISVLPEEWEALENPESSLVISGFNRRVLLEMRSAVVRRNVNEDAGSAGIATAIDPSAVPEKTPAVFEEAPVSPEAVEELRRRLEEFLKEHMADKPDGWKWIITSCLYLSFIAEKPLHPIEIVGIKTVEEDGKTVYECPARSFDRKAVCQYCVCRRMSNYEISKRRTAKEFLKYDISGAIRRFVLKEDDDYIYLTFVSRDYRISKKTGLCEWSEDGFRTAVEGVFNDSMTIYDVLGDSKEYCCLSGRYKNSMYISTKGSTRAPDTSFFQKDADLFDKQPEALRKACIALGGRPAGKGDVSYEIPLFPFLPVLLQFWCSDEDFPADLQIFMDENVLDYMRFETTFYAVGHLLDRIKESMP